MSRPIQILCLLVAAFVGLQSTYGKIHTSDVHNDDRKLIPMTDSFGYGPEGGLDIKLTSVAIYTPHKSDEVVDYSNFGFFLSPVEADVKLEQELLDDVCVMNEESSTLFTFKDSGVQALIANNTLFFKHHTENPPPGLFYLYFANCAKDTPISFKAVIELYNVSPGGSKEYLSTGEANLDAIYGSMCFTFAVATCVWAWMLWSARDASHKIHYLMLALGIFKAATLLTQSVSYHMIEATGHADGWNVAYYFFTFCRGILFFTVVVLVGTGWSYMKPFLGDKEKKILMVVVPLQVFANIAIIITDEESPSVEDWFTWRDIFHLVDIICCCAVLFPIVWSIKHLREAAQTDGKAARNLEKLTLFRQFYVMVVVYIYFTRIIVYLLRSTMEYEYSWVSDAADQLATLAFYVWTAYNFRPHKENPYLKVNEDERDP